MKSHRIFNTANMEIGDIIVADVNKARVAELTAPDKAALDAVIGKSATVGAASS